MFYLFVFVGVWDYLLFCIDIFGCLWCIVMFIMGMMFGSCVDVFVLIECVKVIYVCVMGSVLDGWLYCVDDFVLLIWVYVVEVLSFFVVYLCYVNLVLLGEL